MCGICGQYNFKNQAPASLDAIKAMAETIVHRGPDDQGYHLSGPVGLGFRRLSIIDLDGGHQPMSDQQESVWVVFNGEIYNFPELRQELEGFGHVFRTRSDTEVIVHGYKQWGTEVFNRLNGMFGLAIWDDVKKKLILARDSAGIKLVYYHVDGNSVRFGSEIRTILATLPARPGIDVTALNLFLRYRYTPSPLTLYSDIRKLAPGTMAVFEKGDWRVERWHRPLPRHFSPPKSDAEAKEELLEIYKRAMKRHLLSDVPVGLLLSGGVDSGLLLGLMSLSGKDWPTYTVGYGQSGYRDDELDDAAETAKIFSAKNIPVKLSQDIFEKTLPKIVSVLEEPIAASSIVPMYFVCERARQDVKVALVGQGPDELYGGYNRHLGVHYSSYWRSLPEWLRTALKSGIEKLPRNETLKRGVYSLDIPDQLNRYQNVFSLMPGDKIDSLFQPGLLPDNAGDSIREFWRELQPEMAELDELGGFQVLEIRSSLPDELLMYADKLSMAHSLEVRVPFLDKEIIDYATRLPGKFKVRFGQRKWLHKRVCENFLPKAILQRKKRGFAVNVVDQWFSGSLNGKMNTYFIDGGSLMFKYLNKDIVQNILSSHCSGQMDNHKILFSLIVFEEWLRCNHSTI